MSTWCASVSASPIARADSRRPLQRELSHAGLVTAERDGRHLIYRPAIGRMNALLAYLTAHCCHGEPCDLGNATPTTRKPRTRACTDC